MEERLLVLKRFLMQVHSRITVLCQQINLSIRIIIKSQISQDAIHSNWVMVQLYQTEWVVKLHCTPLALEMALSVMIALTLVLMQFIPVLMTATVVMKVQRWLYPSELVCQTEAGVGRFQTVNVVSHSLRGAQVEMWYHGGRGHVGSPNLHTSAPLTL